MHQGIIRHLKERIVAQQQAQHRPGGGRGQHHRAQNRRVHIAHHLFQGKEHRGHRRIEGGGNGGRGANRDQRLHLLRAQSQPASKHRGDARAHLHRRPLAAQRNAAGQRRRRAKELAQNGAQRDESVARKERRLGLRNAAAARIGKVAIEQIAHRQRAAHRNQRCASRRRSRADRGAFPAARSER